MNRALCLATLGTIALTLPGCTGLQADPNNPSESVLDLLFAEPNFANIAANAQDPFDSDNRFRGTLQLSVSPAGSDPVNVALYAANSEDEEASVRAAACRALGRHGSPEHVPLLVRRLTDADVGVRKEAARALQRIHSPAAIDPLLTALREPGLTRRAGGEVDPDVRAEAAIALAQYRRPDVLQGLIEALGDSRLAVNHNALESLRVTTGQDFGYDRAAWLAWLQGRREPFAAGSLFTFPAYSRDLWIIERLPFIPKPVNESSSTPAGMPLTIAPTGSR